MSKLQDSFFFYSNFDKILERHYSFIEKKNSYILQLDFQQNYSTTHALTHLTDEIGKETDKDNHACEIIVDFQKAFDTLDHHILFKKIKHYGVGDSK